MGAGATEVEDAVTTLSIEAMTQAELDLALAEKLPDLSRLVSAKEWEASGPHGELLLGWGPHVTLERLLESMGKEFCLLELEHCEPPAVERIEGVFHWFMVIHTNPGWIRYTGLGHTSLEASSRAALKALEASDAS